MCIYARGEHHFLPGVAWSLISLFSDSESDGKTNTPLPLPGTRMNSSNAVLRKWTSFASQRYQFRFASMVSCARRLPEIDVPCLSIRFYFVPYILGHNKDFHRSVKIFHR